MEKMVDRRRFFYDYAKPLFFIKIEKTHDTFMFFTFSISNVPF